MINEKRAELLALLKQLRQRRIQGEDYEATLWYAPRSGRDAVYWFEPSPHRIAPTHFVVPNGGRRPDVRHLPPPKKEMPRFSLRKLINRLVQLIGIFVIYGFAFTAAVIGISGHKFDWFYDLWVWLVGIGLTATLASGYRVIASFWTTDDAIKWINGENWTENDFAWGFAFFIGVLVLTLALAKLFLIG